MHRRLVYIYLLNVPSFSSRYFNKIKRAPRLGRLLTLSLEILWLVSWLQIHLDLHFVLKLLDYGGAFPADLVNFHPLLVVLLAGYRLIIWL